MAIETDFTVYPYSKVIRHTSSNDTVYQVSAFYSYLQNLFDEPGYMSYEKPIKYNTPTSYTMLNGWFLDNGDGSNILQYLTGGTIDTTGYTDDILMLDLDGTTDWVAGDKDKTITDDGVDVGPLLAYKNDYAVANEARIWIRDTETHGAIADNSAIATTGGTGAGTANGASITGDEIYTNIYTIAAFAGSPNPQVYIRQNHPQTNAANNRIAEWSNADNWDRGSIDVLIPVKLGGAAIDSGKLAVYVRQTGDTFTHTEVQVSTTGGARTPVATETSADTVNITKGEHYLLYDAETIAFSAGDVIQNVATDSTTPPSWYAEVVAVTDWGTTGVLTLRGLRGSIADNDAIYVGTAQNAVANGVPGDTYILYDGETTAFTVGNTLVGKTSGAKRLIRGLQDDGTTGKFVLQVDTSQTGANRNPQYKTYQDNEVVYDGTPADWAASTPYSLGDFVKPTTENNWVYECTTAGTSGASEPTWNETEGGTTTDGTVTWTTRAQAKANGASTTIISGYDDITIAHINGTVVCDTFSGTFTIGERVTWTGGGPAIIVKTDGSTSITLANVEDETGLTNDNLTITGDISGATCLTNGVGGLTDDNMETFAFPLQTAYDYTVFIECGSIYEAGRDLDDVYAYCQYRCRDGEGTDFYTSDGSAITVLDGQFYIKAVAAYAATKAAPFGTLAGGVFFGARGVWVQGMASADTNNIKLTDHNDNLREPYTSVDVTVSNTRVDDVITVFLEDGATGLPKKDQFSCVANAQSASTLQGSATHPNDTPSSGWVYVVDVSANEEHKYRYTSWSGDTLTLAAEVTGVAETGTSGQTLFDTGVFASGVERGDIIRNVTDGTWCYVISVDSDDQVTTTVLSDGTDWAVGDSFEVNSLVVAYTTSDTYFIPYLEAIEDVGTDASPGSQTNTLTYVSDRSVVIRVRNVEAATPIQPFVTTSDITSAGMTVSVIRTKDEVYA